MSERTATPLEPARRRRDRRGRDRTRHTHHLPVLRRRLRGRDHGSTSTAAPPRSVATPSTRRTAGGCARRGRRSPTRSPPTERLLRPRVDGVERAVGTRHSIAIAGHLPHDTLAEHGPESVAFYASGQLLTEDYYVRQQVREGLARHGQHRHELASLHGLERRRAQARSFGSDTVPGGLRGPRARRPRRPRRQQPRLVPPGHSPAPGRGAGRASPTCAIVLDRPTAHRDHRARRPAPRRSPPTADAAAVRGSARSPADAAGLTDGDWIAAHTPTASAPASTRHHAVCRSPGRRAPGTGLERRARCSPSTRCSPSAAAPSRSSARGSTSPSAVPTRSTPS